MLTPFHFLGLQAAKLYRPNRAREKKGRCLFLYTNISICFGVRVLLFCMECLYKMVRYLS